MGGTYPPAYRSGLLNLYDRTSPVPFRPAGTVQDYANLRLPNVERAVEETAVLLPHPYLLGDDPFIDQLLAAVAKVNDNIDDVRQAWASRSEQ